MEKFFCANSSRDVLEDKIGSATYYQTYVLIEHSTPWDFNALISPGIPENLQKLISQLKSDDRSIRFLLIDRNHHLLNKRKSVLIYHQEQSDFCGGYQRYEFEVDTLEQVPDIVTAFLKGEKLNTITTTADYQDILICVHGSHDVCCAKYGIPFYKEAISKLDNSKFRNVRFWKASHFGGHRFAPTAIAFPDGRYYGGLDLKSLDSIVKRAGDLELFNKVYRGWSILPYELQVLERELILKFGWDWFTYKIAYRILEQGSEKSWFKVEIEIKKPDNTIQVCHAEIVRDDEKTVCLKGSCQAKKLFLFIKYRVPRLYMFSDRPTDSSTQKYEEFPKRRSSLPALQTPVSDKIRSPLP